MNTLFLLKALQYKNNLWPMHVHADGFYNYILRKIGVTISFEKYATHYYLIKLSVYMQ